MSRAKPKRGLWLLLTWLGLSSTVIIVVVAISLAVCLMLSIVPATIYFDLYFNQQTCARLERESGRDTKWDFYGNCFIQTDEGVYVPVENWHWETSSKQ